MYAATNPSTGYWLTSDTTDLASNLMAKDNMHIEVYLFCSVLPFSAIAHGGIVGTPQSLKMKISSLCITANVPLWTQETYRHCPGW